MVSAGGEPFLANSKHLIHSLERRDEYKQRPPLLVKQALFVANSITLRTLTFLILQKEVGCNQMWTPSQSHFCLTTDTQENSVVQTEWFH